MIRHLLRRAKRVDTFSSFHTSSYWSAKGRTENNVQLHQYPLGVSTTVNAYWSMRGHELWLSVVKVYHDVYRYWTIFYFLNSWVMVFWSGLVSDGLQLVFPFPLTDKVSLLFFIYCLCKCFVSVCYYLAMEKLCPLHLFLQWQSHKAEIGLGLNCSTGASYRRRHTVGRRVKFCCS